MTKKLVSGTEYFDGEPVEVYEGRFSGTFQMIEETAAALANDDQVTFIVTARVSSPKFSYVAKTGALRRSNTMKIEESYIMDAAEARYLLDNMGLDIEGVNSGIIEAPTAEPEPDTPVSSNGSSPMDNQTLFDSWDDWNPNNSRESLSV